MNKYLISIITKYCVRDLIFGFNINIISLSILLNIKVLLFILGLFLSYYFSILNSFIYLDFIILLYLYFRLEKFRIVNIFTGYIFNYIVWLNLERINDFLPIYIPETLILPLYFSFYLFNLFLIPEKFGSRVEYFQNRLFFYYGVGLPITILYYFEYYHLFVLFCIFILENKIITEENSNIKRDRWLAPIKGINFDIDDYIESLITKSKYIPK